MDKASQALNLLHCKIWQHYLDRDWHNLSRCLTHINLFLFESFKIQFFISFSQVWINLTSMLIVIKDYDKFIFIYEKT